MKDKNKKTIIIISVVGVILLCVCILIIIFAGGAIIAVNPAKNFAVAKDTQRQSDVMTIATAITQYTIEDINNSDIFDETVTCNYGSEDITTDGFLYDALVDYYIISIPTDPSAQISGTASGYAICKEGDNITIIAPFAETDMISHTIELNEY